MELTFRVKRGNLQRIALTFWEHELLSHREYGSFTSRLINAEEMKELDKISADLQKVCKGKTYRIKAQGFRWSEDKRAV